MLINNHSNIKNHLAYNISYKGHVWKGYWEKKLWQMLHERKLNILTYINNACWILMELPLGIVLSVTIKCDCEK
jgi:hypothetical protein